MKSTRIAILTLTLCANCYGWNELSNIVTPGSPERKSTGPGQYLSMNQWSVDATYSWEGTGLQPVRTLEGFLIVPLRVTGVVSAEIEILNRRGIFCSSPDDETAADGPYAYKMVIQWATAGGASVNAGQTFDRMALYPLGQVTDGGRLVGTYSTSGGASDDLLSYQAAFDGYVWVGRGFYYNRQLTLPGGMAVTVHGETTNAHQGIIATTATIEILDNNGKVCVRQTDGTNAGRMPYIPRMPQEVTYCEFHMDDIDIGAVPTSNETIKTRGYLDSTCNIETNVHASIRAVTSSGAPHQSSIGGGHVEVYFEDSTTPDDAFKIREGQRTPIVAALTPGYVPGEWDAAYVINIEYE